MKKTRFLEGKNKGREWAEKKEGLDKEKTERKRKAPKKIHFNILLYSPFDTIK